VAYREFREYPNGLQLSIQHDGGGVWDISGDGAARASTLPGTGRLGARRRADQLAGVPQVGGWHIDDGSIPPGDTAPCLVDGCQGHYTFRRGPSPDRRGTSVAPDAVYGTCNADPMHRYLGREADSHTERDRLHAASRRLWRGRYT
jgi:hypothetical protein